MSITRVLFHNQIPPITGAKVEPIKAEENGTAVLDGILPKKEPAAAAAGNNGMLAALLDKKPIEETAANHMVNGVNHVDFKKMNGGGAEEGKGTHGGRRH